MYWRTFKLDTSRDEYPCAVLRFEEYSDVYVKIAKALNSDFKEETYRAMALHEWKSDSQGHTGECRCERQTIGSV